MAEFLIDVVVDPSRANRGIKQVDQNLNRTAQTADRLRNLISGALAGLSFAVGIRELTRLADAYTTLTNRVRVATEGAEYSGQVLNRVFAIANRARQPVGQLATLYQRVSVASKELGAGQEDILKFVEATSKALAVQGGSSAESAGALLQLSQAMGNANIQAQEFNSLVDGAFPLLQAVARGIDEAGGSVSKLRQLVLQGRLSNKQFFEALLSQANSLDKTFAQTTPTISQAFTVLRNNVVKFVGEADQATAVTSTFASIIILASNNLDVLTTSLTAAAGAYILYRNSAAITATVQFIVTQGQLVKALATGRASMISGVAADRARARSAVEAATAQEALAVAEAQRSAATLAGIRHTQAALVAERNLETVRLRAQISAQGRAASLSRLAELRRAEVAITRQVTAAEAANATQRTASATATAAVTAAQARQAAVLGPIARLWQSFTGVLSTALRLIGGIPGLIIGAIAALTFFSDQISITNDGFATLEDIVVVTFQSIITAIQPVIVILQEVGKAIIDFFKPFKDAVQPAIDAIVKLFDQIDFSISGVLRLSARVVDRMVGIWVGGVKAIVAAFKTFPGLIGEFIIDAVNGAANAIESLINYNIRAINELNSLVGLDPIELVNIPEIANTFEGGARNMGKAVKDAFLEGFNRTQLEDLVNDLLKKAEDRATKRIAANQTSAAPVLPEAEVQAPSISPEVQRELDNLDKQAKLLALNSRERAIQSEVIKLEEKLRRDLNGVEREAIDSKLRENQLLTDQSQILESLNGPREELLAKQAALNALMEQGSITTKQFNDQLLQLRLAQSELAISQGEGSFVDGFLVGIEQMLEAVRNFESEAGMLFADFTTSVVDGFAEAAANAIVFGESFEDAIGNVARRALADLLAGLIKMGIQFVLNAALGETLGATATATGVAQAGTLATAYAAPAALASLASYGANAVPAQAGIASTVALTQALAALPGFADGGMVSGAGGPRSDSIPAMLSNGEFVVNARSTARFRPMLEQINSPRALANGGLAGTAQASEPTGQSGEPSVNVTSVNVADPSLLDDYMNSPSSDTTFINKFERNASAIQRILGS